MPNVIAFETTTVSAERTAGEIQTMLAQHGARKIAQEYGTDRSGIPTSLAFELDTPAGPAPFRLPINVDAVYTLLYQAKRRPWQLDNEDKRRLYAQAARTAWRIVREWVHAQLTLIQTQMVTNVEVFMPYMVLGNGETAYQALMRGGLPALMAPRREED